MRENIRLVLASVVFSFILFGCDTASSNNVTSTVVDKGGSKPTPTNPSNPDTGGEPDGNEGSNSNPSITTARGDTPPSPPSVTIE